jgi:MFS family permease
MDPSTPTSNHGSIEVETTAAADSPPSPEEATSQGHKIWLTLCISVLLSLVSGTLYGFGRYSQDLRETLGISHLQVQRFGILLDTGNYIGHPLTGWIYDNWGPKVSCLSAAVVVFLSYGSIHLSLASSSPPPLWIIDLGFVGVGFGSGLGYIAALGSTKAQFLSTHHLGRAVAVVAAGYGLSSLLVGISYHRMGLGSFFLFWACLVAAVNILGAAIYTDNKGQDEQSTSDADEARDEGDLDEYESPAEQRIDLNISNDANDLEERLLPVNNSIHATDLEERLLPENHLTTEGIRQAPWSSWRRLDFWLLFGSFGCITGCGLFVINNIAAMVQSIGESDALAGKLVFLLSICNVFGRILMGALADHPRFQKLDLYRYASLLMALALLVSALGGTSGMCLAFTVGVVAFAYGGSWVLIVGILADLYGKADFGKDYGLMAMGPAVSGMLFNSLSALLYQYHTDDDSDVCVGANCYRGSYLITAASAFVGFLILTRMPTRPSG